MDYEKNLRYFDGVSYKGPNALITWGVIISVIGMIAAAAANSKGVPVLILLLGISMLAGGIVLKVFKKKKVVSDAEYDASVAANLRGLQERALSRLGLDEDEVKEIAPICFHGYKYGNARLKCGNDGAWRSSKYEAVTLFFSQNEVHCYTWLFDTLEQKQTEGTDVYFYKDVVSVSTTSETVRVGSVDVEFESFKLTTAGGTSVSASLCDVEHAQRSINAMRALIKSKKMA